MKSNPKIGTTGEEQFVVGAEHVIDFARDGMPEVLSTPYLIRHLERAARLSLLPFLEEGEASVGAEIEIQHLAPTPRGQTILCRARVVGTDGTEVSFQIEARDEHELIAKGFHKRRVIRKDRFAAKVQKKNRGA